MTAPHDVPDAAALLEAVREFIERDVASTTEGRVQFHARVAANVLAMVERELRLGRQQLDAHAAGLAALGVDDEASLAAAIRSGALDHRLDEVRDFVEATVKAKLDVANPRYLEGPQPPVA